MKCVCPMGGDRECPDNCVYTKWRDLSPSEKKAQRKTYSHQLAGQGYTQEEIAKQLGVSQSTIRDDLADFELVATTNSRPRRERLSTPGHGGARSGAGRTRGRGSRTGGPQPQRRRTNPAQAAAAAQRALDEGVSITRAAAAAGLPLEPVRDAVEREIGRREARADPEIDRSELSLTAQQKLDAAIRQHKNKLDIEFEKRVIAEVEKRLDELSIPAFRRQWESIRRMLDNRGNQMPRAMFKKILTCLHPDSRNSATDRRLEECFHAFKRLEILLIPERELSTTHLTPPIPNNAAEWDAWRQRARAERSARRSANRSIAH